MRLQIKTTSIRQDIIQ